MDIPAKPLGIIKTLIETIGLDVTYAYEDLIFIQHNAFLLQMDEESGAEIGVWFNTDSDREERPKILRQLRQEGQRLGLNLASKGTYTMSKDRKTEAIQLAFNQ